MRFVILPLAALLAFPLPAFAADDTLSIAYGLDYSAGKYGGSDTSETWALPLSLKYQHENWTARLGMAYLWSRGTQSFTPEGEPLPGGGTVETTQGYGDVTASLSTTLVEADENSVGVDVTAKIKFGTASARKALGTGENDYAAQVSLYRPLGAWTPYLDLAYRWKGDPAGLDYANVWSATVGASHVLSKVASVGADYSWREKLTLGGAEISEATLYLNYKIAPQLRVNVYGVAGFSDASPDWETGLMLTQRF